MKIKKLNYKEEIGALARGGGEGWLKWVKCSKGTFSYTVSFGGK